MKQLLVVLCALGALALLARVDGSAVAGDQPGGPAIHWKGTTEARVLTDAGHAAMNAACAAEFPGTRLCRETDVFGSAPGPVPGRPGYMLADTVGAGAIGNTFVMVSAMGFGMVNNCAEDAGIFKTKKVGRLMMLEADGNVAAASCKDVYGDGGIGVSCCGW